MKPFDRDRFEAALERVKKTVRTPPSLSDSQNTITELLKTLRSQHGTLDRIMIKEEGKIFFVDTSEVKWIESAGNYIKIVSKDGQHMVRNTMKEIGEKLDTKTFFRIHRSTIINIQQVKVIEPWFHGDYQVIMKDGTKFNMSRNYKRLLDEF